MNVICRDGAIQHSELLKYNSTCEHFVKKWETNNHAFFLNFQSVCAVQSTSWREQRKKESFTKLRNPGRKKCSAKVKKTENSARSNSGSIKSLGDGILIKTARYNISNYSSKCSTEILYAFMI